MARSPVQDTPSASRRQTVMLPVPSTTAAPLVTARQQLLQSWQGRLFLASTALKLIVAVVRSTGSLVSTMQVISGAATVGLAISVSYFVWKLFVLAKGRLLWRVRRKLILSYMFIGVVPALLIVIFFLLGGVLIFWNVSAYLFRDGYDALIDDMRLTAEAAAVEISRAPDDVPTALARQQRNASIRHPGASLAYLPAGGRGAPVSAGPWRHASMPVSIPPWLRGEMSGTIALPPSPDGQIDWVIRTVVPVVLNSKSAGHVIADLPIDLETVQKLNDATNVRAGSMTPVELDRDANPTAQLPAAALSAPAGTGFGTLLRNTVMFLDYRDWETGKSRQVSVSLSYRPSELYRRLAGAQQIKVNNLTVGESAIIVLIAIAALFLIIEFVALVIGLALARSITSSIHQLFVGTERVRQGDFDHRISITTRDQLGELAQSFNQMTGSIEGLLQTAAEKKRLAEELRIARQIQMSLLPAGPINVPGLTITALCVPAREVGGDYYDFFPLPGDRLGVLIADVSGKGTSAALYMAELKGVVLALCQTFDSPRDLLIEVNRIISDNLDTASFITMTYAVIDLRTSVMTYCRAGHTPLILMGGPASGQTEAQILTPGGMVLGLRIDGAAKKFADLLEEQRVDLCVGDVVVLYTDGITEAMNAESDLFGESRLSKIVEEHGHLESSELRERILREIEAFVGDAGQHDDMTMILLKVEHAFAASQPVAV